VLSFLGLASYYRSWIQGFSQIAKPLHNLTQKEVNFEWTDKEQSSFEAIKNALVSADLVIFPREGGTYVLDTDASGEAIGGVLGMICDDGKERVVAYGSKNLSKSQQNYCTTHRELFATRHFMEYWSQYLKGVHFTVRTDHRCLQYLYSMKEPSNRVARWLLFFSGYDFSIEHRAGRNCDALSQPSDMLNSECPEKQLPCGPCAKCNRKMIEMHGHKML